MPFLGELSALFTAFCWASGSIVFAAATRRLGSYQVNITRLILASVYLALLIALVRFDVNLSGTQILYLSISGVIGLTLGDTFLFKAFQEIGARFSNNTTDDRRYLLCNIRCDRAGHRTYLCQDGIPRRSGKRVCCD